MTVVGTRPEIIRLSRVIIRLDDEFDHQLVHTGQNWDPQLSDVFFRELGLRQPDHWLQVPVTSLGATLGGVLSGVEPVLAEQRPDAVLILGDTNSCLAAIMAKRMGIPVFHMEAGNRCFDENVPEETNRRIVDHTADFNLCYTEHARRNLLAEGLPARRVFVTGSPMAEVLAAYRDQIDGSDVLSRLGLEPGDYYVASLHRQENIDDPARLATLLAAVDGLARDTGRRVVVSTHPRLRRHLGAQQDGHHSGVQFLEPFGYFDYNQLQQHARCVLSDSGTISEESAISGFPAVTVRDSMERPEALDGGNIVLTGVDEAAIRRAVQLVSAQWESGVRPAVPAAYAVPDVSLRVSRLIAGLAGVHGGWLGLRAPATTDPTR
ncbi:non-hydrolyzing UDP-N-acetylglucosamine 2-epimerase [Jatrophihabitans endophyticus]|nr:UDP-N-acetylglucosamine 2-epimerase (non-hydrolyzing) [Jatrophihabitans endophyticus]